MSEFSQSFLDRLRQAVALSELIAPAVSWDKRKSNFRRRDYWAPCPFHAEKTASFHVRDDRGAYHCFGCKASGDHFSWLEHQHGLTFPQAVRQLAEIAGIAVPAMSPAEQLAETRRSSLLELLEAAASWYRERWRMRADPYVAAAANYLKRRGVTGETARTFGLGYAPRFGLLHHLRGAGFSDEAIIEAGLVARNDRDGALYERFRDRIMFPIHDARGRVIAFGGRALQAGDKVAKYLNSPETPLYDKSRTLYNLHRARAGLSEPAELLVVEGYLDVIAVHQAGLEAVVATCGTATTEHHLEQLWRLAREPLLCFDGDQAGEAAARRAAELALPALRPGQTIRIASLPAGSDPADLMADNAGRVSFVAALEAARPLHEITWQDLEAGNDLATPERQAALVGEVARRIGEIRNAEVRKAYANLYERRLADRLHRRISLGKLVARQLHGRRVDLEPARLPGQQQGSFAPPGTPHPHPAAGGGADITPPEMLAGPEIDLELALYTLTDAGNAHRFKQRNGHRFRWCDELGWLAFDGRRWSKPGAVHQVSLAIEQTVFQIEREAQALIDADQDSVFSTRRSGETVMLSDALISWCKASLAASKLRAIEQLVKAHLAVSTAELDADPMRLTVLNGTLTFGSQFDDFVSFGPHDHRHLITKLAPVVYDPAARAPVYDAFLEQVQPEPSDRDYLHTVGGISLTGDASVQALWFFYGRGRNGKSTLVEAWSKVLGDYAQTVPIETFLDTGRSRTGDQATPHLVPLVGARLVRASEPERGAKLSEGFIKEITGGEPLKVRELNKGFFDFTPQFKLIISGNYKPEIRGTDDGIWRRMHLVPWRVQVPENQVDGNLPKRLALELSGILNHLIAGLQTYFLEGLRSSASVHEATVEYRDDSDPLGSFLADCVELTDDDADRVSSADLYDLYLAWSEANGEFAWKPTGFGRALRDRGIRRRKISVNYWLGIRLTRTRDSFGPHPHQEGRGDAW